MYIWRDHPRRRHSEMAILNRLCAYQQWNTDIECKNPQVIKINFKSLNSASALSKASFSQPIVKSRYGKIHIGFFIFKFISFIKNLKPVFQQALSVSLSRSSTSFSLTREFRLSNSRNGRACQEDRRRRALPRCHHRS